MNRVFSKFLRKYLLVFFNDILIYNNTLEGYVTYLEQMLMTMRQHYLFAKRSKCYFGVEKIRILWSSYF